MDILYIVVTSVFVIWFVNNIIIMGSFYKWGSDDVEYLTERIGPIVYAVRRSRYCSSIKTEMFYVGFSEFDAKIAARLFRAIHDRKPVDKSNRLKKINF